MGDWSRRKYRRFAFRYRTRATLPANGHDVQVEGITKNVSAGGILLESSIRIPKHSPVTFTIIAEGEAVIHPIEITGEGRVVRVESDPASAHYGIALKCTRPLRFHPFEPKEKDKLKSVLITKSDVPLR